MDHAAASFFYENSISFNAADSSSFARMRWHDRKEHEIRQKNLFQSYKSPSRKLLFGELLDQAYKSTEQLVAPILASAKKFGTTGHL